MFLYVQVTDFKIFCLLLPDLLKHIKICRYLKMIFAAADDISLMYQLGCIHILVVWKSGLVSQFSR